MWRNNINLQERNSCSTQYFSSFGIIQLVELNKPNKFRSKTRKHLNRRLAQNFDRSGIRTRAGKTRLRPERSALDRSAILPHDLVEETINSNLYIFSLMKKILIVTFTTGFLCEGHFLELIMHYEINLCHDWFIMAIRKRSPGVSFNLHTSNSILINFNFNRDQKSAAAGNRTQINCLEGNYANRYTTAARYQC